MVGSFSGTQFIIYWYIIAFEKLLLAQFIIKILNINPLVCVIGMCVFLHLSMSYETVKISFLYIIREMKLYTYTAQENMCILFCLFYTNGRIMHIFLHLFSWQFKPAHKEILHPLLLLCNRPPWGSIIIRPVLYQWTFHFFWSFTIINCAGINNPL